MALRTVVTIAGKELRDAARNRWVLILAVGFAVLSVTLSLLGQAGLGAIGVSGFARTTASLLNAVLLIVPLLGLLMGAVSIAGEREHGTLLTLMAQPVTPQEVVCGKFLGAAAALALAVAFGFGLSGLIIARSAGLDAAGQFLALGGFTVLLGMVYLAIGFGISVLAARVHPAISIALIVWVAATFLSDLGLMGTAIVLRLSPAQLLWCALGNPSQAFRIASVQMLQGGLDLLGSSGAYAASLLGHQVVLVVIALLVVWIGSVLGAAVIVFRRRGVL